MHECLERVAEDLDSTKALLKYGLHGTGLPVLVAMGDTEHPFLKEEDEEDGEKEVETQEERENETRLLKSIDFKKYVEFHVFPKNCLASRTYCLKLTLFILDSSISSKLFFLQVQ